MPVRSITRAIPLIAAFFIAGAAAFAGATITKSGDLVIPKKEVNATESFYQYKVGKVLIEVLALRAPDGTIRTALNTCQVCYASGRGYYRQEGDVLVCQNCGNRFRASQVEIVKGGCNPVPITGDYKTENPDSITISKALFQDAVPLFLKWKKR
jgi:uncharacterized membrane protein